MDTTEIVRSLISRICGLQPCQVRVEGELLGYGLDSLRSMELLCDLEDELGLEIDEADPRLVGARTIGQLAAAVDGMRGCV